MNKLNVLLVGLVAIVCFACLVQCQNEGAESKELDGDDDDDSGLEVSSKSNFGSRDVIEEGVEEFAKKKENACRASKNSAACKTCCESSAMASKYVYEPSALRLRQHRCYCFVRSLLSE